MAVFLVVAPCRLVDIDRRFVGVYCLHHQGDEWVTCLFEKERHESRQVEQIRYLKTTRLNSFRLSQIRRALPHECQIFIMFSRKCFEFLQQTLTYRRIAVLICIHCVWKCQSSNEVCSCVAGSEAHLIQGNFRPPWKLCDIDRTWSAPGRRLKCEIQSSGCDQASSGLHSILVLRRNLIWAAFK
jgi:hypothetical protein